MDSYQLKSEYLSYCHGHWNPNEQRFTENSMDVIQCCLDSCKNRITYCFNTCEDVYGPNGSNPDYYKHKHCHQRCNELVKNCENVCLEDQLEGIKIISECSTNHGCGSYPYFDSNCMNNNKENIINCCKKNCVTTTTTNCEEQCQDFFEYLSDGVKSPLSKIEKEYRRKPDNYKKNKKNITIIIVWSVIFLILLIIGAYVILK